MSDLTSPPPSPVRSIVDALLDRRPFGDPWLEGLWKAASATRPGVAAPCPSPIGTLLIEEAPSDPAARIGKVFDRAVAPPAALLRWMLAHPEALEVTDRDTFGAKSDEARAWRRRLFSGTPADVAAARDEGLCQLDSRLGQRGRNKWWLFEGFARVDACFVTESAVLFVEGRADVATTSSSRWLPRRTQLWRDVEAASEFAAGRAFGVIIGVDDVAAGVAALGEADASLADSMPHRTAAEREALAAHLLGYVVWSDVAAAFELPAPGSQAPA